ncbi:MAG: biopolymer transporter ExbD [Pseudomonadota bacterium]
MLPLINIVFLLLIFFMLTAQFIAVDPFDVTVPASDLEASPGPQGFVIAISQDGRMALDGNVVDEAFVLKTLAAEVEGGFAPSIWIQADEQTEAVEIVAFLEQLNRIGVAGVSLLTVEPEGGEAP